MHFIPSLSIKTEKKPEKNQIGLKALKTQATDYPELYILIIVASTFVN